VGPGHGASAGLRLGHCHAGRPEPTEFHAPVAQLQPLGKAMGLAMKDVGYPAKMETYPDVFYEKSLV